MPPETEVQKQLGEFRAEYRDLETRLKAFRDTLHRGEVSRYVSLAYTELESSRHWLGEALGATGMESPYKE